MIFSLSRAEFPSLENCRAKRRVGNPARIISEITNAFAAYLRVGVGGEAEGVFMQPVHERGSG